MYHFLVVRQYDRSIAYRYEQSKAGEAYDDLVFFEGLRVDCCLFGADFLDTLKITHSNWVDENTTERRVKI